MSGTKTGVVGNVYKAVEGTSGEKPIILHCIIHQQALCGKNLEISEVMEIVVKTVNYIRSSFQKHRQFKAFLSEIDSNYPDVPYHCEVRWLSRGKVLQRFFELHEAIDIFMIEQGRQEPVLSNPVWLWKLAFLVDITVHINCLNLKLQGPNSLITDAYHHVNAFRKKLALFEKQLNNKNLDHFETCQKCVSEASVPFPSEFTAKVVSQLSQQFNKRFEDFDKECGRINMFQNPFKCDIDTVPLSLQLEIFDLTTNETHKENYQECLKRGDLLSFL
ncbi:general transcription factor II-I repeat domain-containing protein 2A-like [Homalodisca vitripennis]|uniref:general transcription factor II-I repeat domain-containing protein 2A-like n=1 Tax=Homalodisca vitripennis TaxID=197043 RepID=UPI001EEB6E9B|nr:general transcription factor II-I repeat domain-containing protein 2A-like [Homalodisca vitripennis]